MLPPVAEIYVVWHPDDHEGQAIAEDFVHHFHGSLFTGLISGAVEVYVRYEGISGPDDAPMPIPVPGAPPLNGLRQAEFTAIVPVMGRGMTAAVRARSGPWHDYLNDIMSAEVATPDRVRVLPIALDPRAMQNTEFGQRVNFIQRIGIRAPSSSETASEVRHRDLAQQLAQLAGDSPNERLKVFISYTNHAGHGERADVKALIARVKSIISQSRLHSFIDTEDLQPGNDWSDDLRNHVRTSAFLALRTDLYASSTWCQAEIREAKCAGVPVVMLDALGLSEERGSFLMDHVPRVPIREAADSWDDDDIRRGLNLLVNECLKRALWLRQKELVEAERSDLGVDWWSAYSPEPTTLAAFLMKARASGRLPLDRSLRIVHPDPPLLSDEREVLEEITELGGLQPLDILTPRSLAARGGLTMQPTDLLPADALSRSSVGLSVSESTDLGRLGLLEEHFKVALAELTRAILTAGGNIVLGGRLRPEGYTTFVANQTEQSRYPERPFLVCLPWQEHRQLSLTELRDFAADLDDFGTLVCLDVDGKEMPFDRDRDSKAVVEMDQDIRQRALTNLRKYMLARESGRVLLGGRRSGFQGITAGLVEEAYLALEARQPIYLAAGFGGVTADIAQALGVAPQSGPAPRDQAQDPRLSVGLARLEALTRQPDWQGLRNGLNDEENAELIASYRPADIASLVCLGLGRLDRRPTIDTFRR